MGDGRRKERSKKQQQAGSRSTKKKKKRLKKAFKYFKERNSERNGTGRGEARISQFPSPPSLRMLDCEQSVFSS